MLAINLGFFAVLRMDAFHAYRYALNLIVSFLGWLGIATTIGVLEAYVVLIGFLTSTIAASVLIYFGLQAFRTQ